MDDAPRLKCSRKATLLGQGASSGAVERLLPALDEDTHLADEFGGRSRRTLGRAKTTLVDANTPFGPLLQYVTLKLTGGKEFRWRVVDPYAFVWWISLMQPLYGKMLADALLVNPSSPLSLWPICVYADEATGGNVLRIDSSRKAYCFYWQFLAIDDMLPHRSCIWNLCGVLRTRVVQKIEGGVSAAFQAMMKHWFRAGQNMLQHGFRFVFGGECHFIFARVEVNLGDAEWHRAAWRSTGSAGIRVCPLCSNVVSDRSGLGAHLQARYVDTTCSNAALLILHSDESIWQIAEVLRASHAGTKTERESLETRLGFNSHLEGILMDRELRQFLGPTSVVFDWLHVFLSDGLLSHETWNLIERLGATQTFRDLHVFFNLWRLPSTAKQAAGALSMWNEKRAESCKKAQKVKAGASEWLDGYSVFRAVLHDCVPGMVLEKASCLSLLDVIDCLCSWPDKSQAPKLQRKIAEYLERHKVAYPDEIMIPKFHQALHIPLALSRLNKALACFVHERKHQEFKQYANEIAMPDKDDAWEMTIQNAMLNHAVTQMNDLTFKLGAYMTSSSAAMHYGVGVAVGDFAFFHVDGVDVVAKITAIELRDRGIVCIGDVYNKRTPEDPYTCVEATRELQLSDILGAAAWANSGGGVQVLKPAKVAWRDVV